METFYINNEEEGIRKIYSDDGTKLEKEFDFKEGVMVAARYYKKGKVIKEEKFDFEKQKEMLRNIPSDNTQR